MTMPEVTADGTAVFTLEVSDGTSSRSTTINITAANIVLTPENTVYQRKNFPNLTSVSSPKSLTSFTLTSNIPFGGVPPSRTTILQALGEDDAGARISIGWNVGTSEAIFATPASTSPISDISLNSDVSRTRFTTNARSVRGEANIRDVIRTDRSFIGFEQDDTIVLPSADFVERLSIEAPCGLSGGIHAEDINIGQELSDNNDYTFLQSNLFVASRTGGLTYRVMDRATTPTSIEAPTTIISGGQYCDFLRTGEGHSSILTVDQSTREIVHLNSTGTFNAPAYTQGARTAFDRAGSDVLQTAGIAFTRNGNDFFVGILVTDGNHEGTHRFLIYKNTATFVSVRDGYMLTGIEFLQDITLPKGEPNQLYFIDNKAFITSKTTPYVTVFPCLGPNPELCDGTSPSFIEIGFDADDLLTLALRASSPPFLTTSLLLVAKPLGDEVIAFENVP